MLIETNEEPEQRKESLGVHRPTQDFQEGSMEEGSFIEAESAAGLGHEAVAKADALVNAAQALHVEVPRLPHEPGVYLFKDDQGHVLYVGKARDLRKRVASYLRSTDTLPVKTRALLKNASHVEFVVTGNEKEALLLESSLIKRYRPRYNVVLRDDKNYPALRLDPREPYPRLSVVRRFEKDGALYFGPYHAAHALRETLKVLHKVFPLRLCKSSKLIPRDRPCLNHSLGRCLGACAGKVSQEEYRRMVDEVILFLQGKTHKLQRLLKERMHQAAEALDFERAAFYRDRLQSIEELQESQHIVSSRLVDQDVLGCVHEDDRWTVVVLFVRRGAMVGQRTYRLQEISGDLPEVLASFVQQFYGPGRWIPDEIIVPMELDGQEALEEWLSEVRGKRVRLWAAQRGLRRALLDMAHKNALEQHRSHAEGGEPLDAILQKIMEIFQLPRLPRVIVCVDISNMTGRHAVGSAVTFVDGRPRPSLYRRFAIRSFSQPDDPGMMAETVERLLASRRRGAATIDLLVLDGGKSQLHRIAQLLENMGLRETLPILALAKEKDKDVGPEGRGFYEKVYVPGRKNPVFLSRHPEVLHFFQRLRDEAHRFAIGGYKHRHRKELLASALDDVKGLGRKRKQALLAHFGDVESLRRATLEDLKHVPGLPEPVARNIVEHFRKHSDPKGA
ncbi:excinuclease ABC subunit UvrC [Desulfosoma caldarium]|uniref:excinuclease ABC subunit UvrC n=1 Tax=Desulfosoma caldarium TaxID=610254 RepID=UPI000F49E845|nr:excinuclease ABC subunit UvrC [Desulfosoma caldarium]